MSFTLSPVLAVIIFTLACLSGYKYRRVWRDEGAVWKLWFFGSVAAMGLIILAIVPLAPA